MTDNVHFEAERARLFTELLAPRWQNKMVWEHIRDKNDDHALCATPAFEGTLYHDAKTKIMFVGRDLNGWTEPIGDCSTLENTVYSITYQDANHAFSTLVNCRGVEQENGGNRYYHKNSKFFRFIKHVLEYCGESEMGIENTWYNDPLRWNQRFVWANLFCIAPRNPNKEKGVSMHADGKLQKLGIRHYVDLIQLYIAHYKPDAVVFITDLDWFIPWKREVSFRTIVDDYCEDSSQEIIVATGAIGNSRIVVCKRPDRYGISHEGVRVMSEIVAKHIKDVLRE